MVEKRRRRPVAAGALDHFQYGVRAALGEAAPRRDQAADHAGQFVRVSAQSIVRGLQPDPGCVQLAVFQADERERERRYGIRLSGLAAAEQSRPGADDLRGRVQPAPQGLGQREIAAAGD